MKDAQISFSAEVVAKAEVNLDQAAANSNAALKIIGEVYEFNLSIVSKDGKTTPFKIFEKPLLMKFKVNSEGNEDLLGVYYIADNGKVEYVGGTLVDGYMVADVTHFSKYAGLEYNKTFTDVSEDFWAAAAIKKMAAKHIVAGVTPTQFAPHQELTRADFAAMLARTLGLKAKEATKFTDVSKEKWYADAIAAAYEAGIVSGRSETLFAPDETVSREEMAAMLIKAYKVKTGKMVSSKPQAFDDASLFSAWAANFIQAAYELELMSGVGDNKFDPKGLATRAQAAQVIAKLLTKE